MSDSPLDTNVIVRYLIEDPSTIATRFRGVYSFFDKLEKGHQRAFLPDLVLFQSFFVLTSHYSVPAGEAAEKLKRLIAFRGIEMTEKHVAAACLVRLRKGSLDLVDAWLLAWCEDRKCTTVYSFDTDLPKHGLKLLPVC